MRVTKNLLKNCGPFYVIGQVEIQQGTARRSRWLLVMYVAKVCCADIARLNLE